MAGFGYSYTDVPEQRAELERNGWMCRELSYTAALAQPAPVAALEVVRWLRANTNEFGAAERIEARFGRSYYEEQPDGSVIAVDPLDWATSDAPSVLLTDTDLARIHRRVTGAARFDESALMLMREVEHAVNEKRAAPAPAASDALSDDQRNAVGAAFSVDDLKLPLPPLPEPFIPSTEIGYALHRSPEVLRFGADCYRKALASPPAVVPAAPSDAVRPCEYCDGTGDVHGLDGEWRGVCICPAAAALQTAPPQAAGKDGAQ